MEKVKPAPESIRFPPDMKQALKKVASKEGRSFSNLVLQICRDFLAKKKS